MWQSGIHVCINNYRGLDNVLSKSNDKTFILKWLIILAYNVFYLHCLNLLAICWVKKKWRFAKCWVNIKCRLLLGMIVQSEFFPEPGLSLLSLSCTWATHFVGFVERSWCKCLWRHNSFLIHLPQYRRSMIFHSFCPAMCMSCILSSSGIFFIYVFMKSLSCPLVKSRI